MNKRAHTPTILLFVTTIVLVVLALFTFASFNDKFAKDSQGRSQILSSIAFYEQYVIKETEIIGKKVIVLENNEATTGVLPKEDFKAIAKKENLGIAELNSFFDKIEKEEFEFKLENNEYAFEMENLPLESSNGANILKRNINFQVYFDKDGNIVKIEKTTSPIRENLDLTKKEIDDSSLIVLKKESNGEFVYIKKKNNSINTNIYFSKNNVFAESYSGRYTKVGKYDANGWVKIGNGLFYQQEIPGERRIVLNEINKESVNYISAGNKVLRNDIADSYEKSTSKEISYGDKEPMDSETVQRLENQGVFSCGPRALKETFSRLDKEVSWDELGEERTSLFGRLIRGIGSIFSSEAKGITTPGEMKSMIESFGFKYTYLPDETLDCADKVLKEKKDIVIITRIDMNPDGKSHFFSQHWTVYIGGDKFYDLQGNSARDFYLRDVLAISKNEMVLDC